MTDKQALRTQMRAMRKALSQEAQQAASRAVCKAVRDFEPYRKAGCVMAYIACRGELDVSAVIRHALEDGKTLALPRCEESGTLTARKITSPDRLAPGAYGIPEPEETDEIVPPEAIDLILVPGVAFDRACFRLGQGGGYYDRFLKETSAVRAGICHDGALIERVPREAHDIPMDAVITPDGLMLRRDGQEETT